jgi:hypothetical protein
MKIFQVILSRNAIPSQLLPMCKALTTLIFSLKSNICLIFRKQALKARLLIHILMLGWVRNGLAISTFQKRDLNSVVCMDSDSVRPTRLS